MVLVYQAYGREDILRQTLFSVVSLLKVVKSASPLKIWIYTDNLAYFEKYFGDLNQTPQNRVRLVPITPNQLERWRGAIQFVHRVKVEILIDAAKQFSGSLFYVDGDTYFREDPTALFNTVTDQTSLMHEAENSLEGGRDPLSKKIAKFIKKNSFVVQNEKANLSVSTVMWNAGALGMTERNKQLLPLVLELTDKLYSQYAKHIMEQLAFSHYLQTRTTILAGDKVIGHYWRQKDDFQSSIDAFLKLNTNLTMALGAYNNFSWPQLKIAQPVKRPFWQFGANH